MLLFHCRSGLSLGLISCTYTRIHAPLCVWATMNGLIPAQCGMSTSPLSIQEAYLVANALKDLADYISEPSNEKETKDRQKLLRNLRVLELIISILGLFEKDARDEWCVRVCVFVCLSTVLPCLAHSEHREVCQACYLVIKSYLKGDSRKNENYLARFIDFFQKQVFTQH